MELQVLSAAEQVLLFVHLLQEFAADQFQNPECLLGLLLHSLLLLVP